VPCPCSRRYPQLLIIQNLSIIQTGGHGAPCPYLTDFDLFIAQNSPHMLHNAWSAGGKESLYCLAFSGSTHSDIILSQSSAIFARDIS
jgi:hypothetical protein